MEDIFDPNVIKEASERFKNSKQTSQLRDNRKKVKIDGKEYMKNPDNQKLYGMPRMVLTRKIARNMAKKAIGNNRIQRIWRDFQIERYGISKWCYMFNKCNRNNKTNYITPKEARI